MTGISLGKFLQVWILILTPGGIILYTDNRRKYRILGCLLSLAAQPAWIISNWQSCSFGEFWISIIFIFTWGFALVKLLRDN